jgi:hypothetical protein
MILEANNASSFYLEPEVCGKVYSLKTLEFVDTIDFQGVDFETIKATRKFICLSGCESISLYSSNGNSFLIFRYYFFSFF